MPQEWFRQIGGLKLNGTLLIFAYADDKIMDECAHTTKKNTEDVVANKGNGPEVNAEKPMWSCLEIKLQDKITI
jgi:hypothetical protein